MTATYSPWDDLASRPDLTYGTTRLPHGDEWWLPQRRAIITDSRLSRVERRCALAHALAHVDHQDVCQPDNARVAGKQETWADQDAAHRLIALDDLAVALRWSSRPSEIADDLQVTEDVLQTRLDHLHPSERAYLHRQLNPEGDT